MGKRLNTVPLLAIGIFLLIFTLNAFGQEEEIRYRHQVTAGVSVGEVVSETGSQNSAALGFDYLYRLNSKWEVGAQFDLNYDRSFEDHDSDAIVAIASYSVTERLPLFFGAGMERERSTGETTWLARAGFEYTFFLDDEKRWSLLPGGFLDFIDGERVVSVVVAVGFVF